MRRILVLSIPVAIAFGGWFAAERYKIEQGPTGMSLKPRDAQPAAAEVSAPERAAAKDCIRMATVNLDPLGESKL